MTDLCSHRRHWCATAHVAAGLALASVVFACDDPSIRVAFELPDGYRAGTDTSADTDVRSATLRVLQPSPLDPFTCDDIAFGAVSSDTLSASLLQEVSVAASRALDLVGIPRLGTKLFWIEGLDAQRSAVVAGCAQVDEIAGDQSVTVIGHPTAVVTVDSPLALGTPLPASVTAFVTDSSGAPLSNIDVAWTVVGPADTRTTGSTRTDAGVATITPDAPALTGPALLDIHVRWQKVAVPPIVGFRTPPPVLHEQLPGDGDTRDLLRTDALYTVGPIGPAGQIGFAALGPPVGSTNERIALIAYFDPATDTFQQIQSQPIANARAIGRLRRSGRDGIIVAAGLVWHELAPGGQTSIYKVHTMATRKLLSIGGCVRIRPSFWRI